MSVPQHGTGCHVEKEAYYRCSCGLDRLRALEDVARLVTERSIERERDGSVQEIVLHADVWMALLTVLHGAWWEAVE